MDVYKIAVEIALAGTLAEGLTRIAGQMTGLHGQVGSINSAMLGWKGTLGIVAGAGGIGLMVAGLDDAFKATEKLSHELSRLKQLGADGDTYAAVRARAAEVTRTVPGSTETGNIQLYNEIQSIAGKDEALKMMETLSRAGQVFGAGTGDYGSANDKLFDTLRAADIIGRLSDPTTKQFDPKRFTEFLDVITKVGNATGWRVNPETWLGMAKQGGISLRGLSNEGLMEMSAFAQNMGGPRAGTAMMSLFQQFAGGTMFKGTAQHMQDIGLLKEGEWGVSGGRVQINEEASKRLGEVFKTDPMKGLTEILMPAMKEHGFDSPDDQIRELFKILQRQTTQRFLGEGAMNVNQMLAEVEREKHGQRLNDSAATQNSNDLEVAIHNLGASFNVLGTAIGGTDSEIAVMVGGLNSLTRAVGGFTEIVRAFENAGPDKPTGAFGRAFRMTGPAAALSSLGALSDHAPELQSAAASVHSIFSRIESFIGSIRSFVPSWLGGGAHNPTTNDDAGGLIHKEGFVQPDPTNSSGNIFHLQNFVPPPKSDKPTVLKAALNIDSRQLAEAVSYALADMLEVSPNSASGNGAAFAALNGWNPVG